MRVLFVYPVPPPRLQVLRYQQGIGSMSAVLKQAGHQTDLLIQHEFVPDDLGEAVRRFNPGLVAISATSGLFPLAREIARAAARDHGLPVIMGGVHPTLLPEESINAEGVFAICRGEGEYPLLELCDALDRGADPTAIRNLWVRRGDRVWRNKLRPLIADLDALPFPDRELFHFGGLLNTFAEAEFMGSRGCPYRCTYCVNHALIELYRGKGPYVRFRSVDNLLAEIGQVAARYPQTGILGFHDDTFTLDRRWLREFAGKYPARFAYPFWCNATAGSLTQETVDLLSQAGCEEVRIGIESGDDFIRREVLDKQVSREEIVGAFDRLHRAGINTYAFNMIGLPGETPATIEETVRINADARSDQMFLSVFQPYPGTRAYDLCLEKGWCTGKSLPSYFADDYVLAQPTITRAQVLFYKEIFRDLVRHPLLAPLIKAMHRIPVSRSKSLYNAWRRVIAKARQAAEIIRPPRSAA